MIRPRLCLCLCLCLTCRPAASRALPQPLPQEPSMDLEELRAFLAVVEAGSFLAAADALGVPRTTLRRRVDALEARAGTPLLDSGPAGVQPTAAGSLLAERGHQMILEGRALLTSIRELGQVPAGTLRVGLPVGLPPHAFSAIFSLLRNHFPALDLTTTFGVLPHTDTLLDHDLIAHFSDTPPPGPWLSFIIARPRRWLIASQTYLAHHGTPLHPNDLSRHTLFSWAAPGEDPTAWPLHAGGHVTVKPALSSPDIHLIRACCLDHLGIGFVPDALLPDPPPADTLIPILPDLIGSSCTLRLTIPTPLAKLPKIKAIIDKVSAFTASLDVDAPPNP